MCKYRNLPIKRPWALEIDGQKTEVGVYTEKLFVRITHIHTDHRIIQKRGWALTRENTVHENIGVELQIQFNSLPPVKTAKRSRNHVHVLKYNA